MLDFSKHNWEDKISHIAQVGGIETATLNNGQGAGTRVAWFNSGSGLRFKVVLDRAMDIAEASFGPYNLTWISALGTTAAQPLADRETDWLRTFNGGLLTTCGLTHVGGPEKDEYGYRGLHDRINNIPAEIISIKQPDPRKKDLSMSITGRVLQGSALGQQLLLTRTISCVLGEAKIHIEDEVCNLGNTPSPHMLLYHMNFGWPFIDEGTKLLWKGDWQSREPHDAEIFVKGNDFRTCPAPLESHRGTREEAAFIDSPADNTGLVHCGAYNPKLNLAIHLQFPKATLPWLTNWQHWGPGEYVMGLEPGSNPPVGQHAARQSGQLRFLAPNEIINYHLDISLISEPSLIEGFVQNFNQK